MEMKMYIKTVIISFLHETMFLAAVVDEDSLENSQGAKSKRRSMPRSAKKPKTIEIDDDDDVVEIKINGNSETPKPGKYHLYFLLE